MTDGRDAFVRRVARRIADARRARGWSQETFAARLGIATKNVQRIEAGKQNLSLRTVARIAQTFDVTPETLIEGAAAARPEGDVVARLERAGFATRSATVRGRRPVGSVPVTTLQAAAGSLGAGSVVEVLGWVRVPRRGAERPDQFVAEVRGGSMSPRVPDRSICLFGEPRVEDGRLLLVRDAAQEPAGSAYALKRVRVAGGERSAREVVLESLHPDYPPVAFNPDASEIMPVAELVSVLVRGLDDARPEATARPGADLANRRRTGFRSTED